MTTATTTTAAINIDITTAAIEWVEQGGAYGITDADIEFIAACHAVAVSVVIEAARVLGVPVL